jgi:hypothetical protein
MTGPGEPPDNGEPEPPLDDDERWLRAREDGSPRPPLSRERAAAYEALTELVRERGRFAPPPSARDELRAALDREQELAGRRRARARWFAIAATGVAAAAVLVLWLGRGRTTDDAFMVIRIEGADGSRSVQLRGDISAAVGERLVVDARHPELKELRVYREDRDLVARCPGDRGCAGGGPHWKLTMRFAEAGTYRAIRIDKAVVPSTGYGDDMVALRKAGAALDDDHLIRVR